MVSRVKVLDSPEIISTITYIELDHLANTHTACEVVQEERPNVGPEARSEVCAVIKISVESLNKFDL